MKNEHKLVFSGLILLAVLLVTNCQSQIPTPAPIVTVPSNTLPATATQVAATLPVDSTVTEIVMPVQETITPYPQYVMDFPDPINYTWQSIADGFSKPLGIAFPESSPPIFYVLEQAGVIKVVQSGQTLPDPFLDIRKQINSSGNEQGLLGIALDPLYAQNGIFYLNFTNRSGSTTISRFTANADRLSADPGSEQIMLTQEQPYQNHNGGNLAFGSDGFLYIGFGDGGSGGDPQHNAQNPDTLLGKIIRIAVRDQHTYAVPENNPYVNGGGRSEIWAIGLRNPWRFSFDLLTGDLYIADVGQGDWEEIDFVANSFSQDLNFGWNYREGTHPFTGEPPAQLQFIDPIFEYDHSQGCSVTGGYVYRGKDFPEWNGVYFFGDYCTGRVWGLLPTADGSWKSALLFESGQNITSFGQDRDGEIFLIAQSGSILKLAKNNN